MSDCERTPYALTATGYGKLKYMGKTEQHHRVVYCEANGVTIDSIKGQVVMHKCDNRWCINPDHLALGTQAQNNIDMHNKLRHMHGAEHTSAKLTAADVVAIRAAHKTQGQLAVDYGVSFQTISDIQRRLTWKHVT